MYTDTFEKAIDQLMLFEVGSFWELTEDARCGNIETAQQRKECGYTNDADDRGGETKYGISQRSHPGLDIASLNWDDAKDIYFNEYWLAGKCDQLPDRIAILHFDSAANHGLGRAAKFLQNSVDVDEDGHIGKVTITAVLDGNDIDICNEICDLREKFYKSIVERDPTQKKFIKGWLRRINEMREFSTLSDF